METAQSVPITTPQREPATAAQTRLSLEPDAGAPSAEPDAGTTVGTFKAHIIHRLVGLIRWPTVALGPRHERFELCTLGEGDVPNGLERVARRKSWQERPAHVRRLSEHDDFGTCHLLYIAESARPSLDRILSATARRAILTVGDGPGFGERGAILNLILRDSRIRFELNMASATLSGLQVSEKMVRLSEAIGSQAPR